MVFPNFQCAKGMICVRIQKKNGQAALPFTINDPDIAYLYANGVVDNVDGYVQILVPLYSKALLTAMRPLLNGETREYVSAPNSKHPAHDR